MVSDAEMIMGLKRDFVERLFLGVEEADGSIWVMLWARTAAPG